MALCSFLVEEVLTPDGEVNEVLWAPDLLVDDDETAAYESALLADLEGELGVHAACLSDFVEHPAFVDDRPDAESDA